MNQDIAHRPLSAWWILLPAVLATIAVGWPSLSYPYGRDQGLFGIIGSIWLHGGLPYRDAWDIKPPFVFGAYSIAEALFGYAQSSIRILDLISVAVTAWLVALIARRAGATAAIVAAVAYPFIYFLGFGFWETAQAESFALPFSAAAMLLAIERRSQLLIGLCIGTAAMFKPTFGLLFIPVLVFNWTGLAGCLLAFVGGIAPAATTLLYFAARDGLDLLYDQVELMRAYASPTPPDAVRFSPATALRETAVVQLAAFIGLLSLLAWRDRVVQLAWAWWLAGLAMLIIQDRYFSYHVLPMAPPAALLLSIGIGHSQRSAEIRRFAILGALILAALVVSLRMPYFLRTQPFTGGFGFDAAEDVRAARVIARTPGSTMWVDAFEPNLYFLTRRYPPTRHLSTAPIVGERQIPRHLRERLAQEVNTALAARPPDVLVEVGIPPRARFNRYGQPYEFVSAVGKYRIYRIEQRA